MHELTICENLLELLDRERHTRHFERVCRVRLEVGRFSCVDPDALYFAFDILSRETFLEGAVLEIDQPPGLARCLDCGASVAVDSRLADCPSCGSGRLCPTGGDQMRMIEMEVM